MPRVQSVRVEDEAALPDEVLVDVPHGPQDPPEQAFSVDPYGDVTPANARLPEGDQGFLANLALGMEETTLNAIAQDILEMIAEDDEARAPWKERFQAGLAMIGLVDDALDDGPFPGASTVTHPLIAEAQTQFWARSFPEVFPPDGPVKVKVIGKSTVAKAEAAARIEEYHNHDMTVVDEAYYPESRRLLWLLPIAGTMLRKTFRDPISRRVLSILVSGEDFITPSTTVDFKSATRYAHRIFKTPNELAKLVHAGVYRKCELQAPPEGETDPVKEATADASDVTVNTDPDHNPIHTLYEVYIEYDLPGHEATGEDGEPLGIARPYVITIEKDSAKVLSIYRGWREGDEKYERVVNFSKWEYLPGFGFYGTGLIHLMGGLQKGATGALRALLDGAATASIPGGFIAKDAQIKDSRLTYEPGVWKQVPNTSEELSKAFHSPPTRDPSPALFQLLGFLVEAGRRLASTTETMVGETSRQQPVGTTMALIEQGQKVHATIHRGLFSSLGQEIRQRHELAQANVPGEGYAFDVDGDPRIVFAEDFQPGLAVLPVADPNVFSNVMRIEMAKTGYQLALENPDIIRKRVALRRLLEAIKMPDVDELMVEEKAPMPYDPVGEVQAILTGHPVAVTPEQPHQVYIQHLYAFATNPAFGGNPEVQKRIGGPLMAIMGQHLAYLWLQRVREQGVPAPAIDVVSGQPQQPEVPPEQLMAMIEQISPALVKAQGLPVEGAGQDSAQIEARKMQLLDAQHQQKMRHEDEAHRAKLAREAEALAQKLATDEVAAAQKLEAERIQMRMKIEAAQVDQQLKVSQAQQAHDLALNQKQAMSDIDRAAAEMGLMHQEAAHRQKLDQKEQDLMHAETKRSVEAPKPKRRAGRVDPGASGPVKPTGSVSVTIGAGFKPTKIEKG